MIIKRGESIYTQNKLTRDVEVMVVYSKQVEDENVGKVIIKFIWKQFQNTLHEVMLEFNQNGSKIEIFYLANNTANPLKV